MAPSKRLKITDQIRSNRKDRPRQKQDDTYSTDPSTNAEDETLQLSQGDSPVTNQSLHTMLLDLKESLRSDFWQITKEIRRDIQELGGHTSRLESKTEELCSAHNDVVDQLQRLEEEQSALKLKMADMQYRARRNNLRFQ
ncbi:Hypothetical predicted protein [Pelobates cultripes]|uniref:Uncharacterized protein n=1 Tax=Pelobates cultripes TaxID=61616 RepID=A0AAD1SZS1_PELCU|nr:Hypothetical predicted protein [Pelobates cultripes]